MALVKGNGRSAPVRMAKLLMGSSLSDFDEPEPLNQSDDLARLQDRNVTH